MKHSVSWTFVPPFEQYPSVDENQRSLMKGLLDRSEELYSLKVKNDEYIARIKYLEEEKEGLLKTSTDILVKRSSGAGADLFNGHDYVDLGLPSGTLWATCNVGAFKPSDCGKYFAWGETVAKHRFVWSNLKYRTGGDISSDVVFSKYVMEGGCDCIYVDNRNLLELADDAANVNWGGAWRIPTREDWEELFTYCEYGWTLQEGQSGAVMTGDNGMSIFLPAVGFRYEINHEDNGACGSYWSSSLYRDMSSAAFCCYLDCNNVGPSGWRYRYYGLSVRPVVSVVKQ